MPNISYFKQKLTERHAELKEMIAKIEDRLDDPHSASFSEQAVEREDEEVLEIRGKFEYEELKAVEAALSRIENDAYGICLICQNPISDERLEAVPFATLCRHCMKD